jgi:hypothetical protein
MRDHRDHCFVDAVLTAQTTGSAPRSFGDQPADLGGLLVSELAVGRMTTLGDHVPTVVKRCPLPEVRDLDAQSDITGMQDVLGRPRSMFNEPRHPMGELGSVGHLELTVPSISEDGSQPETALVLVGIGHLRVEPLAKRAMGSSATSSNVILTLGHGPTILQTRAVKECT